MTSDPRASFALDLGSATSAVALIGRVNGRRRLLAAESAPAGTDLEALLGLLVRRLAGADPDLARELGLDRSSPVPPDRLVARTAELPRLAILATSERERAAVQRIADSSGWRATGLSLERADPIDMAGLGLERDVAAIVVAAGESPALDPKPTVAALAALGAAVAGRDPGRPVVLAGLVRSEASRFIVDAEGAPPPYGPAATAGDPAGAGLRQLLDAIQPAAGDGRHGLVRAIVDLAAVLDRRVELVEIGFNGGLRVLAGPDGLEVPPAIVADAALVPPGEPEDSLVDGVLAWSSIPLDRHRMRDRLRELRLTPWGEAYGAGAVVRYAAARAALERLVEATPEISRLPAPDLIVIAGGAWAVAPGPAIALALADLVRRPGASQLAWDHARLLGPIGMIEDRSERRAAPGRAGRGPPRAARYGRHPGRRAGRQDRRPAGRPRRFRRRARSTSSRAACSSSTCRPASSASPSSASATRSTWGPAAGTPGSRSAGGLGGLLVDLRDVPLRLPDRLDRRRALLGAWQAALWPGLDV